MVGRAKEGEWKREEERGKSRERGSKGRVLLAFSIRKVVSLLILAMLKLLPT